MVKTKFNATSAVKCFRGSKTPITRYNNGPINKSIFDCEESKEEERCIDEISNLILNGEDINKIDLRYETPIFTALKTGNHAVLAFLLELGAEIIVGNSATYYNGLSNLFFEACMLPNDDHAALMLILQHAHGKSHINIKWDGETPIHCVISRLPSSLRRTLLGGPFYLDKFLNVSQGKRKRGEMKDGSEDDFDEEEINFGKTYNDNEEEGKDEKDLEKRRRPFCSQLPPMKDQKKVDKVEDLEEEERRKSFGRQFLKLRRQKLEEKKKESEAEDDEEDEDNDDEEDADDQSVSFLPICEDEATSTSKKLSLVLAANVAKAKKAEIAAWKRDWKADKTSTFGSLIKLMVSEGADLTLMNKERQTPLDCWLGSHVNSQKGTFEEIALVLGASLEQLEGFSAKVEFQKEVQRIRKEKQQARKKKTSMLKTALHGERLEEVKELLQEFPRFDSSATYCTSISLFDCFRNEVLGSSAAVLGIFDALIAHGLNDGEEVFERDINDRNPFCEEVHTILIRIYSLLCKARKSHGRDSKTCQDWQEVFDYVVSRNSGALYYHFRDKNLPQTPLYLYEKPLLFYAAQELDYDLVTTLLTHDTAAVVKSLKCYDHSRKNVLHYLVLEGTAVGKEEVAYRIAQDLILAGAGHTKKENVYKYTPAMLAVANGCEPDLVELLGNGKKGLLLRVQQAELELLSQKDQQPPDELENPHKKSKTSSSSAN